MAELCRACALCGGASAIVAARDGVAAALAATHSIRNGSLPEVVPELDPELRAYFEAGQPGAR